MEKLPFLTGEIPEITNETEQDFLDGVLEVYSEIFSKKVEFYFLDENSSNINSYGEASEKKYREPIELNARIKLTPKDGEKAVNRVHNVAYIRIPTLDMWNKGIPTNTKTLSEMNKGKFKWNNLEYEVTRIQPRTMTNDTFIVHEFICDEIILEHDRYRDGW